MVDTMIHGTSESTLWLAMPKTARKMSRMDTRIKNQGTWSKTQCNAKLKWQTYFGLNFQAKIASRNCSKSSPKMSKWLPKSILEASWDAKLKRLRFLMPRERLKDLSWGAIWESKTIPNPFQKVSKTQVTSKSVLEQFWNPLETEFKANFKVSAW